MKVKKLNNVIISADDFGISKNATERILELVEMGKIDRVEVMMSKNITHEQAQKLNQSGVNIDIHFHLVTDKLDKWQSRQQEIRESNFNRIRGFIADYLFNSNRSSEVEAEWHFQLTDFRKLFRRNPDGVSSHEHIHFFPAYFKIIEKIAKENDIKHIRFGTQNFKNYNPVCMILNMLRKFDYKNYQKYKMLTTNYFVSFDWIKSIIEPLKSLPTDNAIELVFHPERDDEFEFLKKMSR